MRKALALTVSVVALALQACATTVTAPPPVQAPLTGPFQIAITIDDLPVHGPLPAGMSALDINRQMVDAIRQSGVQGVTGFVNGSWTATDPTATAALELWDAAGIPLANHTWSHPNLNDLTADAYKQQIAGNEPLLKRYASGDEWRWFRYPFLAEGDDPAKRQEIRTYLADRGYRVASVSMDFSDWKFTGAYTRCKDAENQAAIRRIEQMYLESARAHIDYSRRLGRAIYGREIPQVQLMHVGAVSAHMMPRLVELYRAAGAQFVSLDQAQSDPAYAEDNNPRLPPRSQFIGQRAQAMGISIAPPPDPAPELDAMCLQPSR